MVLVPPEILTAAGTKDEARRTAVADNTAMNDIIDGFPNFMLLLDKRQKKNYNNRDPVDELRNQR